MCYHVDAHISHCSVSEAAMTNCQLSDAGIEVCVCVCVCVRVRVCVHACACVCVCLVYVLLKLIIKGSVRRNFLWQGIQA